MAEIEYSNKLLYQNAFVYGQEQEQMVRGIRRSGFVYDGYFYYRVGTMFFRVRYE